MLPKSALRSSELTAALVLLAAVIAAIVLANMPVGERWSQILDQGAFGFSLHKLINDGLMAIFFLAVGLELKKEMIEGTLANPRKAVQPVLAAAAGMIVPALIYVVINWGDATALRGWAIPAATDIAFALGALALLGSRIRSEIRVFLLALAVADDLGAILVIAFFYSGGISATMLGGAMLCWLVLMGLNRLGVRLLPLYLLIGLVLWYFMYRSGVHATLAGVMVAFTIPHGGGDSKVSKLEHELKPLVSFLVLPIFALANAGIAFSALSADALLHPVSLGAALGLVLGKPLGITLAVLAAAKLLKEKAVGSFGEIFGVASLAGIGFTMSLFIGGLAFRWEPELFEHARAGIYAGSVLSALLGLQLLTAVTKREAKINPAD
jgi:Na+:H+ antiporter, NhaA family